MAKRPPEIKRVRPPASSSSSSTDDDEDALDDAAGEENAGDSELERHGAGASSSSSSSSASKDASELDTQPMEYPKPCKCTKDPCPCYCHTVPDSVRAIAFARPHTPRVPEQILRVKLAGNVINVPVCWTAEQVAEAHAKHRDGVVDLLRLKQPGYQALGTPDELQWLHARAAELAKK